MWLFQKFHKNEDCLYFKNSTKMTFVSFLKFLKNEDSRYFKNSTKIRIVTISKIIKKLGLWLFLKFKKTRIMANSKILIWEIINTLYGMDKFSILNFSSNLYCITHWITYIITIQYGYILHFIFYSNFYCIAHWMIDTITIPER